MKKDWETYCLMSGIMYIEELSKPKAHKQTKIYKGKSTDYTCYRSLRLKVKDYDIIKTWFDITKYWENKLNLKLIGKSFSKPKIEKFSNQYNFNFTPLWLYEVMKVVKILPSKYVQDISLERLRNWKPRKKNILSRDDLKFIENGESLYKKLLNDKKLAAGAIIISMDLEFRGITTGRPSLAMSDKYKDFLEFMLKISNNYRWTTSNHLFPVNVNYSINLGIKASPQFEFRISSLKLHEIYELAGPLCERIKNKAINFHANRSKNYKNLGGAFKFGNKKEIILKLLKEGESKTTELQYGLGIGIDVILGHLHRLEKEGKVNKVRQGKRYIWNIKNAN